MSARDFVSWLHIGDLHASDEDGWESIDTLARIVDEVQQQAPRGTLDFAFLPGDNANHGEPEQYRRIAEVLARLELPQHAIAGDHDFEPKSLANFHEGMQAAPLPKSVRFGGRRALFLDIVSPGSGGPDFRLGAAQTSWLRHELEAARKAREPRPLVFMHAFPGDLHEGAQEIGRLFAESQVAFVDTGHTHYNELLNDGAVVYSATRSTGQVEEGTAGFAIAAVDGDVASWRFKSLATPWPWVLITSPADARMTVHGARRDEAGEVRALVLGRDVARVDMRIDDGPTIPMQPVSDRPGLWAARSLLSLDGAHRICVRAVGAQGAVGNDEIRTGVPRDARALEAPGDHRHTVGAWAERGLLGTRLGPNANGRHW